MSDALFEEMANRAKSQPGVAKKINAVFLFDITKNGKSAAKWSKSACCNLALYLCLCFVSRCM